MEVRSYADLLAWIQDHENMRPGATIILDGESGSGKTRLAMYVAKAIGAARVSTDCYVLPDRSGPYIERLATEYLIDDFEKYKNAMPYLVVEGICIRDTMNRVGRRWEVAIYVKKKSCSGLWHFEHHLKEFTNGNPFDGDEVEPFRSDYEYHGRVLPHKHPDITYTRVVD